MNVNKQTVVRVVITAVAVINGIATMFGAPQNLLQIDETTAGAIYEGVSALITVVTTCWVTWKNNSFTKPAITADKVQALLKDGYDLTGAVAELTNEKKGK